jgi:hypothetical protein
MNKTNKEKILDYLWSIAPKGAGNSDIQQATAITSHQQVYLLTQELRAQGLILGRQEGRQWLFYVHESAAVQLAPLGPARAGAFAGLPTPRDFEQLAQRIMSRHFGVPLERRQLPGVPKEFDLVSPDGAIAGDAKYFTLVRGQRLPPAKFSIIVECVWLLEKTAAPVKFLVFGHDREVPQLWLARYGPLLANISFYFLNDDGGSPILLNPGRAAPP